MTYRAVALLVAACLTRLSVQAPLLPSQDQFYVQPGNISVYQPGEVIRSRTVPNQLSTLTGGNLTVKVDAVHQYLYRTTDSLGQPVAAVTTLFRPKNADPTKLLAYQTAYDSANNDCSPSYGFQSGANTTAGADSIFITAALNKGWYVVSSDYEGLRAQYTAGVQAGYATLDSVRASLNTASTNGLSSNARYAMWGYSGGALASEWAAELQPSYAPELHFEGAALGGLIPNVSSVLSTINRGPFAGLAFSGARGVATAYPNLTTYFNSHLIPSKKAEFNTIGSGCLSMASSAGAFKDFFSYFDNGAMALQEPVPSSVLAASGQMGTHGVPTMPLFFYKARGDEVSPAKDTDDLYRLLCSKGATIEYHADLIGDHLTEQVTGSSSAFAWVADRLNGIPVANQGTCVKKIVALTSLDLATAFSLGAEAIALLQQLLGN